MINLIPPAARRNVVREYWIRVISVWMFLMGTGFLVVAALLLPTFVLIRSQINVLSAASYMVAEKVASYDVSATELKLASTQAVILASAGTTTPFSAYLSLIEKNTGDGIQIRSVDFSRAGVSGGTVVLSGESKTRQALADFRDLMESEGLFTKVDLPISNLIKERDVLFSMQMVIATNTPTL
jgi:Tfp pilus assembly protein PilN